MKIYFPDDPVKQKLLEGFIELTIESINVHGKEKNIEEIELIEKATGKSIEEVLSECN